MTSCFKMGLYKKIIFLCIVLYPAVASETTMDATTVLTTSWNQSLLITMKWVPHPNNGELFYDILLGENNHSLASLHWNGGVPLSSDENPGFNLTVFTNKFDGNSSIQEPCLIPAGKDMESLFPVQLVYLRSDRVLVFFKKHHKTEGSMQIPQVINPQTCKIEEGTDIESHVGFSPVSIVPFKDTFDVIFYNQTLCPEDWWCKMTFDHDGKKLSEPTSLFKDTQSIMYVDRIYPMNYESGKEGHVVVTKKKSFSDKQSAVYSPVRGWIQTEDLKVNNHFYSNNSGYASICWQTQDLKNIKCSKLDKSDDKDKNTDDSTFTIKLDDRTLEMPYIRHSPTGKIAMLKEGLSHGKKVVFSDTAAPDGKCKRYMETEFDNDLKRIELSVVDDHNSCISLVTRDPNPISNKVYSLIYAYKFVTKCVEYPKDFVAEKITCGKDYIFS